MVQGGTTATALVATASWLALVLSGLVHAAGGEPPRAFELACALVAAPVALAGAFQAVTAFWRGPTIVAFPRCDAVPLGPAEATFVRAAAQLRGMIGGGGHLYPRRLVYAALAWLGAGLAGLCGVSERLDAAFGAWPVTIAVVAALFAVMFPPRAFFYRDTTGGGALVSPPSAAYRLRRLADVEAASRGEVPAPTPPVDAALSDLERGERRA